MSPSKLSFLSDALLEEIGDKVGFSVCQHLNRVCRANGVGTYDIGTRHKEAYAVAGRAILRAAVRKFEWCVE